MLRTTFGFMRALPALLPVLLAGALALALTAGVLGQAAAQQQQGQQAGQTPFRPVAVVNGAAITGFDLIQRAQIMLATGHQAQNEEELRAAALDQLISDWVKMQEADRLGLGVSDQEIEAGIAELAQGVGVSPEDMLAQFAAQGVGRRAIEDLVAADVVWRKVVGTRFSNRLEPDEAQIDAELARAAGQSNIGYRLGEIGLPIETGERSEQEILAFARELSRQLAAGGDFQAAVERHSRAVSAAQGGDVGWVTLESLPPEVAQALDGLEPGAVTEPVRVEGGYSILKVLDKRRRAAGEIDPSDPNLRQQVGSQIAGRQSQRLAEGLLQELRRDALIEVR